MPADVPFHLSRGVAGPVQQSPVTCGSAALTVARMLASPEFALWIVKGLNPKGGTADPRSERERFAEHEIAVMNRTNGFRGHSGAVAQWSIPWPRALGTPPWGAARELEDGAPRPGALYAMRCVRLGSTASLYDVHRDLARLVSDGLPALLYVGNAWAPRHVTLLLPGGGWPAVDDPVAGSVTELDVYDPATGSVTELDQERFASRALGIAGWDVPWITVHPRHP